VFTGIVDSIGTVHSLEQQQGGLNLYLETAYTDLQLGESVAVDGVCLTVAQLSDERLFLAHASSETLQHTTLGELQVRQQVHLERAACPTTRLGGHVVTGHVDGLAVLKHMQADAECQHLHLTAPKHLVRFIAPKGSVALNGTSLTVNRVTGNNFEVMLVPHTLAVTSFGGYASGQRLNLEVDILAKYVAQLLGKPGVDVS